MNQNQRYECRAAFQINGIHAVWHEPGACTLQNLASEGGETECPNKKDIDTISSEVYDI